LRFARNRFWPSRAALDELSAGLETLACFRDVRWYGAPHIERIARWLFSNPPRAQTFSAVLAALRAEAVT